MVPASFLCTYQLILSWDHLSSSIEIPCGPLCQRFHVLFLRSNPCGPIQGITPRTHPSRFHGRCWIFLRYYIYLAKTQRRKHLRPSMPIGTHSFHSPSVLGSERQKGPQYDSISFRFPHWFHSSCWPPWSLFYSSNTSLSANFWLQKLACDLKSSWNFPCSRISCLIHQFSPPTTIQVRSPWSQIPNKH